MSFSLFMLLKNENLTSCLQIHDNFGVFEEKCLIYNSQKLNIVHKSIFYLLNVQYCKW